MASLVKQHGRYYLQFYAKDRTPHRKRVALKTDSKRTATQRKAKLEHDYVNGDFDPWCDDPFTYDKPERVQEVLTVTECLRRFLNDKESDGCTKSTVRTYSTVIGLFVEEVGTGALVTALTESQVRGFVTQTSLSAATCRNRHRHLRAFLSWCVKKGYLQSNVAKQVRPPKAAEKLPKAIAPDQLRRICDEMRSEYESGQYHRQGEIVWMIPLFRFALYTGLRASELARLRWRDVDFNEKVVFVRKQKNRQEGTVPLSKLAAEVLGSMDRGDDDDFVFRSPSFARRERSAKCFAENVSRSFLRYRRKADVKDGISFHSLRHGFCTLLAQAGKPAYVIKEAARHADIKTSLIYVHMTKAHIRHEIDDAFE